MSPPQPKIFESESSNKSKDTTTPTPIPELLSTEILTENRVIQITHGKRPDEPQVVPAVPGEVVPYMTGQQQAQAEINN